METVENGTTLRRFTPVARVLHWVMAPLILAMLFIGVWMVSSLAYYHTLVAIHRPLGISILLLAILRLINRLTHRAPALPGDTPKQQRMAIKTVEVLMYTLMIVLPLVGWGMLSAARYPIVMFGAMHLPPILPGDPTLYAFLRQAHTVLAYLFFFTFIGHLGGALMDAFVEHRGIFQQMAGGKFPGSKA